MPTNDFELMSNSPDRVEENEKIAAIKMGEEIARNLAKAEAGHKQAAVEAETSRILRDEETRSLRERLAAENTAEEASLQRQFIDSALPEVAQLFELLRGRTSK